MRLGKWRKRFAESPEPAARTRVEARERNAVTPEETALAFVARTTEHMASPELARTASK